MPMNEHGCVTLVGHGGVHLAQVWNGGTRDPKVAEANAARICLTWNTHDALLAALREAAKVSTAARRAIEDYEEFISAPVKT